MADLDEGLSNEELFSSALSDLPEPEAKPEVEAESETRARDDQGRFVEKQAEPEKPKAEAEQAAKPAEQKEEAQIPSWRARELRERADAAEARARQFEAQLRSLQPKPEATARPDIFENPDGFLKAGLSEALTPLEQRYASLVETFSRKDAIREHGEARVTEAFGALDQAAKAGDPQALAVVQAVKQSTDPFGDIVNWYRGAEASRNPEAFFQRKLEEALKDEKFRGELKQKLEPPAEEQPAKPVFKVPPSMRNVASAAASLDEGGDLSNESLFSNALR